MSLTPDDVDKIAHLARLALSGDELSVMAPQLDAIVGYMALLEEVDTTGVEPLAHALPVQNVFRDDEPGESLPVSVALANAPVLRKRTNTKGEQEWYFGVPAVLED